MATRVVRTPAHLRILGLLAIGAAGLAGCGLPPGGNPPDPDLVVEVISTDPHVAAPVPVNRIGIEIEIEVTRVDDSSVGSMSIEDVDGLPTGWSTSTSSSCIDIPTDHHCTAKIDADGPLSTPAGDYPIEVELSVGGSTIVVEVTLTVP